MDGRPGPLERTVWAIGGLVAFGMVMYYLLFAPLSGPGLEFVYEQAIVTGIANGIAMVSIRRGGEFGEAFGGLSIALIVLLIATLTAYYLV